MGYEQKTGRIFHPNKSPTAHLCLRASTLTRSGIHLSVLEKDPIRCVVVVFFFPNVCDFILFFQFHCLKTSGVVGERLKDICGYFMILEQVSFDRKSLSLVMEFLLWFPEHFLCRESTSDFGGFIQDIGLSSSIWGSKTSVYWRHPGFPERSEKRHPTKNQRKNSPKQTT